MNRYLWVASFLAAVVCGSYIFKFGLAEHYSISDNPEQWGQLGDYIGGLLNPSLSFISIVLLIKSLTIQNQANSDIRREIENTRKTEKLRSFESQLFHMVNSLRESFDKFRIKSEDPENIIDEHASGAVIWIETKIENMRETSRENTEIVEFLNETDSSDQVFGLCRMFYHMVKLVSEKLSDSNGFSREDRNSHYLTIINFTDFALLRLIMMTIQFQDYESCKYIRNNSEFYEAISEMGMSYDMY
ncbi:conserved protein of unknown function [Pseudomonas sp. JV551A1]|uniref:Phage abortive infection protein n=1 Tax=Pseudomonas inefficax TaxID=2078786 RepID=A0AAQ1SUF5_9PSED|nr:hypothetical protein [Pseudomonas]SPO54698.1 conserved protein of unknown function [Pseudomonas sp. JV551A1]SPO62023.1 conserved protein of unknown function [Pseudomonas inefficax]